MTPASTHCLTTQQAGLPAMNDAQDLKLAAAFLRSIWTEDPKVGAEIELLATRIDDLVQQVGRDTAACQNDPSADTSNA